VAVREVHVQLVRVDAQDERSAIDAVRDGMGEEIEDSLEYSHTLITRLGL
jgi:hypothetical protein